MYLMLKDTPVLNVSDDLKKIQEIIAPELLPVAMHNKCSIEKFNEWLSRRSMPCNRAGLKEVKEKFGERWLKGKNLASLTDQYWIRRRDEKWKKVSLFSHAYSYDIGNAFFCPWTLESIRSSDSPDLTTGGILRKRWKQDGKSLKSNLIKEGCKAAGQEPLYEVLTAVICENLGIKSADYELCIEGYRLCSSSSNLADEDTELVTAADIYYTEERKEDESIEEHLIRMCDSFGIPGVEQYVEDITLIDILTGNNDRNLSNMGFIRNTDTREFIGPAPVYDSGSAYAMEKKRSSEDGMGNKRRQEIMKKASKKYNLEKILKDEGYIHMAETYPGFGEEEKTRFIGSVRIRNEELLKMI